jgi:heme-degrading monooxygenase HmoA
VEKNMFSVLFEVHPKAEHWDTYLGVARMLRPEIERIDGFIDNIRYKSLTREGWIFSLSTWRDEKALVRWRTQSKHHAAQDRGRTEILSDYHLRVGEIVHDSGLPDGEALREQRLDETAAGSATTVTLTDAWRAVDWIKQHGAEGVARSLGLDAGAKGLVDWDVFDAVLSPGDVILMQSWRDKDVAAAFARSAALPQGARFRQVRVVRDYGMYDRREAPQFYPDASGRMTIHA